MCSIVVKRKFHLFFDGRKYEWKEVRKYRRKGVSKSSAVWKMWMKGRGTTPHPQGQSTADPLSVANMK